MSEADEGFRRKDLKRGMRQVFDQTLDERVERYLEVAHQGIVPNHHFAAASSECIDLYRDGYALSAVMVSQAVAEGIWRFVLERNQVQADRDHLGLARQSSARSFQWNAPTHSAGSGEAFATMSIT